MIEFTVEVLSESGWPTEFKIMATNPLRAIGAISTDRRKTATVAAHGWSTVTYDAVHGWDGVSMWERTGRPWTRDQA